MCVHYQRGWQLFCHFVIEQVIRTTVDATSLLQLTFHICLICHEFLWIIGHVLLITRFFKMNLYMYYFIISVFSQA